MGNKKGNDSRLVAGMGMIGKMKEKRAKIYVSIGIAAAAVLTVAFSVPFIKYINDPQKLRSLIDSFGALAPIMFVLLSMIQVLIPFIPGEPFELLAGYAFGALKGTILCIVSGCIASFIIVLIVKKFGSRMIRFFFREADVEKIKFLKSKKSFILYTIIFIFPGTPKDLLCYTGGLCDFNLIPLLVVVSIGRIPGIITSTIPADALGSKRYLFAIIAYSITAFLCLSGFLFFNRITAKKERKNESSGTPDTESGKKG